MEIILASGSPRRKQLLAELGLKFEVNPTDIDESVPSNISAHKVALYLAQKKGAAARDQWGKSACILAADSVVILNSKILGKPKNRSEAINMILALSGKNHQVHTGFHLQYQQQEIAQKVVSNVFMDTISQKEAEFYVDNYQPYDKAGSYAIQEWIGHCKVRKIEGSYTNIVGLPTHQVYRAFRKIKQPNNT